MLYEVITQLSSSQLKYSYSSGVVTGNGTNIGGLVGYVYSAYITSSYYDGIVSGFKPLKATDYSKLTTGMKAKENYTGWDFTSIWTIEQATSYPYLRSLSKPSKVSEGLPQNDMSGGIGTTTNPYIISTKERNNFV